MKIDSMRQEEVEQMERNGWSIEDDQAAEWALQKIKDAQADCDRWERYYAAMAEKARNNAQHTIEYMRGRLQEYFQKVPHKRAKTQEKYSLPSGDLIMKTPKLEYVPDYDKLVEWLKENGLADEYVKRTETPAWGEYKKRLDVDDAGEVYDKQTGRLCTAVTHRMTESKFEIKTTE